MLSGMCKKIVKITSIGGIRIRIFTIFTVKKNSRNDRKMAGKHKKLNIYGTCLYLGMQGMSLVEQLFWGYTFKLHNLNSIAGGATWLSFEIGLH